MIIAGVLIFKTGLDEDIPRVAVCPISYRWVSSPYIPPLDNEANLTVIIHGIANHTIVKPVTTSTAMAPEPGINVQLGCSDLGGADSLDSCFIYVNGGPHFGTLHQAGYPPLL